MNEKRVVLEYQKMKTENILDSVLGARCYNNKDTACLHKTKNVMFM